MGEEAGNQVRLGRGRIKSGSLSRRTHLASKPDRWSSKRARRGTQSTCCSWWVAREAPRGFLIGWINQLARPSLQRHSSDLMHQCVADSSILQPLHTLLHPASQDGKTNIFEMLNLSLLQLRWVRRDGPSLNGRLTGKVPGTNLIDSKGINWRPDGHSYDKAAPAPRKLRIFTFLLHARWKQENHVSKIWIYDLWFIRDFLMKNNFQMSA